MVAATIGQYKAVLNYLGQDIRDSRLYDSVLTDRIKSVLNNKIYYKDIYNYFKKYKDNLKSAPVGSDDWCFIVAVLLVEKNMYPPKFLKDPLIRISTYVNAWLYEPDTESALDADTVPSVRKPAEDKESVEQISIDYNYRCKFN